MSYIRSGYSAVRPYVYGPHSVLTFVERALGGQVMARHEGPDNAAHIEVNVGDAVLVLELRDPPHESGFPGSVYAYVEDVDQAIERCTDCDVTIFAPPEDKPYFERQAGIRDAFGNVWWVSTYTGTD